ncbi:MAG: hypothetical protein A2W31_17650 [Planctomycetes bacterium RBG_16_64_10]|nr:MAG: hypothetical protein A2W31_17650 [Planctomycetes bacterium RBG_16_64_10]
MTEWTTASMMRVLSRQPDCRPEPWPCRWPRPVLGWLVLLTHVLPTSVAAEIQPVPRTVISVDGPRFAATLSTVDQDGSLTFAVDQQPRPMALADLVVWGSPCEGPSGCQVLTTEGSVLAAQQIRTVGQQLWIETSLAGPITVPLDAVCSIVFQPSGDPLRRDPWTMHGDAARPDTDQLILANDDTVTGTVVGIDPDHVELDTPHGDVRIAADRIALLQFQAAPGQPVDQGPPGILVGWYDGTLMHVRSLVLTTSVQATLRCGARVSGGQPADLVCLQPLGGRVVYLSDLRAASYRHVPYLALPWPLHRDRNALGGRLRAGGQLALKGLGMHSAARLAFRLNEPFRRFEADLAIDDQAGHKGSVQFRVLTHVGATWTAAYQSPIVCGGADPIPLAVDLTSADAICLLVDFADRGDELDYANWLNARLVR